MVFGERLTPVSGLCLTGNFSRYIGKYARSIGHMAQDTGVEPVRVIPGYGFQDRPVSVPAILHGASFIAFLVQPREVYLHPASRTMWKARTSTAHDFRQPCTASSLPYKSGLRSEPLRYPAVYRFISLKQTVAPCRVPFARFKRYPPRDEREKGVNNSRRASTVC